MDDCHFGYIHNEIDKRNIDMYKKQKLTCNTHKETTKKNHIDFKRTTEISQRQEHDVTLWSYIPSNDQTDKKT
jgi:hypothetical protein